MMLLMPKTPINCPNPLSNFCPKTPNTPALKPPYLPHTDPSYSTSPLPAGTLHSNNATMPPNQIPNDPPSPKSYSDLLYPMTTLPHILSRRHLKPFH